MTEINIELDMVQTLAKNLKTLYDEFEDVPDTADGVNAHLGSQIVRDAIQEFSDNWNIRRGRLLESVEAVRQMAADAHEGFSATDLELANQILGEE